MPGPNDPIYLRDGRCVRCGERPNTVQHRIHGNRKDRRPSNLLSACMGPGTKDCHSWMEANREAAAQCGWECSKFAPGGGMTDTAAAPVWMPWGLLGKGWYLLPDDGGMAVLCDPQPDPPHLF